MSVELQVIPGYEFRDNGGGFTYVKTPDHWDFETTARSFHEVDIILNGLPSKEIVERFSRGDDNISVLDIGGGFRARAALDIDQTFKGFVNVTNLDIVQPVNTQGLPINSVLGDATEMPIPDEQFDIAISTYVLRFFRGEKLDRAIAEVVRVLKPGGVAFIHEGTYVKYKDKPELDYWATLLGVELSVDSRLEQKHGGPHDNRILVIRKPQPSN